MRFLVDTNVVARLAQPGHHQHDLARRAVAGLLDRDDDPCLVPQVVYEFWVVATRPASANGLNLTGDAARGELAALREVFTLLRDERTVFQRWEELVTSLDIRGKSAHDARLVAAMHRHAVEHLLTFNIADFARFKSITVLSPEAVGRSV